TNPAHSLRYITLFPLSRLFSSRMPPPPRSPLFPYTTLFRSCRISRAPTSAPSRTHPPSTCRTAISRSRPTPRPMSWCGTCSNWRKAPSTAWPPPWTRPPSTGLAAMLGGAGSIELCAAGSGLYLLEEFAFRLMKFGFRVNVISNSVNLSYIANQMDPTHCLLLLSYTGMNEAIGSAMRFARQHGTPVLLITGHADSPAARLSDCVLLLPLLESNDNKISTFSSTIAAKAMLDLVFARLFQN